MKKFLYLLLLVPLLIILIPAPAYSAPPPSNDPISPHVPIPAFDPFAVNIPDPNLRAALHDATGVPDAQNIHKADLAALSGTLWLDSKNIANAEGVQYCINITVLILSNNSLTAMPDMSGMTGLRNLHLDDNDFTSIPAGVLALPGLTDLYMSNNPITSVDPNITDMTTLRSLSLPYCKLTAFPSAVLGMDLKELYLNGNDLGSIPGNINAMTHLEVLRIIDTGISSLPNNICSIPTLIELNASRNKIYDLPSNIGDTNIKHLLLRFNRIETLPASIGSSTHVIFVDVALNRLTSLPGNFADKNYNNVDVEFNFIDMSAGSPSRLLMDGLTATQGKKYMRQLTPISVTAEGGPENVQVSWEQCPDGSGDGATWTVTGYIVYLRNGDDLELLDEPAKGIGGFAHVGLAPVTEYKYRVGVKYRVKNPLLDEDVNIIGYVNINATTLAAEPSSTASVYPSSENAASAISSTEPSVFSLPADAPSGSVTLPLWVIVVIAVAGIGALVTVLTILIIKTRKKA